MGLEKKERRTKIVAEWRRLNTLIPRAAKDLRDAKALGLSVKAEIEASIAAGDGLYDAEDVTDMQALIDLYQAEVATL
jgi:hypothetical protein